MNEENTGLIFVIGAEDNASKALDRIQTKIDSLSSDAEKLKKMKSIQMSLVSQMKRLQGEAKATAKEVANVLRLSYKSNDFNVKRIEMPTGSALGNNQVQETEKAGNLIRRTINETKNTITEWTEQVDKSGNKVIQKWKQEADGLEELVETTEKFAKPKIFEGLQGNILSKDTKTGIFKTEEILQNGNKIIRTYSDVTQTANGYVGILKKATEAVKKKDKEEKRNSRTLGNLSKGASRISRIFQSIIAFRLASSVITVFVNSFKKGFEALKQTNKEVAESMRPFQIATTQISISLATLFLPVMQSLATILNPLANDLMNMANAMSLANAQAQGQSEYFKLSQESIAAYSKSLNEANKQLSQLDKFATLNGKKSVPLGQMVAITPDNLSKQNEESAKVQNLINVFRALGQIIQNIIDLFGGLSAAGILNIGALIFMIKGLFSPISAVIGVLLALFSVMKSSSTATKILSIGLASVAAALAAVGIAKTFAKTANLAAVAINAAAITGIIGSVLALGGGKFTTPSMSQGLASNAINETNQNSPAINLNATVQMDGRTVGQLVTPNVYEEGKKQRYW